ncbi:MAG: ATP-binding protein, partial [Chloroflexota bacterium]
LLPLVGFSEIPGDRAIVERVGQVQRQIAAREKYDSLHAEAMKAQERVADAEREAKKSHEALEQARAEAAKVREEWEATLAEVGLDAGLEPGGALAAIGELREVRANVLSERSLRQRVTRMRETVDSVESQLSKVLADAGMRGFERTHAAPALEQLEEAFSGHQRALDRRAELDRQDEDWEEERARLEARLSEVDEERGRLLAEACVEDEQAFRTLGEQVEERRQLQREVEQIDVNHPELGAYGDASLVEELESSTEEDLQARREELAQEIERAEQAERETWQQMQSVDDRRRVLEGENPAGEIQIQIAELEERVKEQSRRWAVLTIARHLLEETRNEFQRERQAPLLQTASHHFKRFTLGRYTSVEAVIGENRMQVLDGAAGGRAKEVSELSRGTAEQLFLAMRFALIEEYARNAEPMPVLMDDVMVNFDPARAAAVCDSVVELSGSHQVIALTCHPGSVRQLQEAAQRAKAPAPHTVELSPAVTEA